jgi:polysaccharide export outer membrane protein
MKLTVPLACCAGLALSGCATLPTAGPSARQVVNQAVVDGRQRYDVVDVNVHVVSALLAEPKASFSTMFGRYGKPPEPKIGIGDTVAVSIWEAAAGGLFGGTTVATPENVATGSHSVAIPSQIIARDGAISVPYAGRVPVAGKSPLQVQREIEARLAGKAIEPQAIVEVTHTVTDTATVEGEVVNGARVPLSVGGDRLLDLIAAAGGAKSPVYATFVRLSRDGATVTIPMTQLIADPRENIYAWPGDVLTLVQIPQTFSVFGATGANTQLPFNAEHMNLAEAVARAGGLQDQRADPSGVFLFRYEPPAVVGALGAGNLATGPDRSSPVVYRLDFRDADSYFLAKQFPLEDKDVIYVSNALLSDVQKFFTLLNTLTGPVVTGIVVNRSVNQ